ncbi:AAA family ATPase [Paenibacillus macerans]|uniref:AAA family ATPase n=1 Tax=Paenibacillus macerans TaxID=44252 RepID=UPI002E1FD3F1|nr:AAA family ATPase [Paenibacillus macerans]MED4957095.1 AAA family ATPase [Paenibacillus macerans]
MELREAMDLTGRIRRNIGEVVVGKEEVVDLLLAALLGDGHVLLEDVPGTGKTLLAKALAKSLGGGFKRVQFTPDLLPSDLSGIHFFNQKTGEFEFRPGPVFTHVLLADEINRATPKTQSALLEAMQEQTVTVGGETRRLPQPFFVLATQNPLENEGTYPLPEAQLDRFMLKIHVGYPSPAELTEIVRRTTAAAQPKAETTASAQQLLEIRQAAKEVLLADEVLEYGVRLLMMTHPEERDAPESVRSYVRFGSGPRGIQAMVSVAKVRAISKGRMHVSTGDIKAVAVPALRHRLFLNFEGQAAGVATDRIIEDILAALEGAQ